MGGWVGGLSETGNKAISASIEVEVELSWVELRLSLAKSAPGETEPLKHLGTDSGACRFWKKESEVEFKI